MKLTTLLFCIIILTGCSASTGQVEIFSVNNKNKLDTPLENASILSNHQDVIQKTSDANALHGEDTFSIYMTDSYFRYLPDLGGVNEVIIVVEFTEAVTGTDKDTITKILGPYDSVADATKAPFFHKLIYGPKRMESDILSMSLKIFEYDLEENKSSGTILDLISTSAEALSLANPVTIAEIKTVKEIAKAIINTNDNDLVFQIDMDLVAGNSRYNSAANKQVNVLPLKAGELVMIKQEVCGIGRCYNYFSNNEYIHKNPVGYIADGLMLLPTAIVRGFADTPSSDALSDIDTTKMEIIDAGIEHTTYWSDVPTAFKEKTWLRLSILKGGDPSLWAARKALYPSEEDLNDLLKSSGDIDVSAIEALGRSLQETKDKIAKIKEGALGLSSANTLNGTQFVLKDTTSATLCLKVPNNIKLMPLSQKYDTGIPTADGSPKNQQCYTLKSSDASNKFVLGTNHFQVNYKEAQKLASLIIPVQTVDSIIISNETACKLDDEGATKLTFDVNHTDSILGLYVNGSIKTPSINTNKVTTSLSAASDSVSVKTIFKSIKISVPTPSNDCT
jgi:hypothetical protein